MPQNRQIPGPVQSLACDLIEAGGEHFRLATHPERVLFWMADTNGACELVSGSWTAYTGQQTDHALGQGWLDAVAGSDRPLVVEALQKAVALRQGLHHRYRMLRRDGRQRWVLHHAEARFLPSGKFVGLLGTIQEESDEREGEIALARAAQQIFDFLDNIQLAAVAIDFHGCVVHCNEVTAALLDRSVEALRGVHWITECVSTQSRVQVSSLVDGVIAPRGLPLEMEYQIDTPLGPRLFRWHLTLIRTLSGAPTSIAMLGTDITQWREAGNQSRLTSQVFDASSEAMVITDRNNCIVTVNSAFTRLTGYTREEALGSNPSLLQSGRHDLEFYQSMWRSILEEGFWRGDIWDRRKDGSLYPKFLAISAIRDADGGIANYSAVFYDVTERKALEDRLDYLAHYDTLTGLPNRMLLQDRLEQVIAFAERKNQVFALLFVDLDGFKKVNDVMGHAVGDEVLRMAAKRMQEVIRGMDTAARLGGDEFVIILTDIRQLRDAESVATKVVESLSEPYGIDGVPVSLTASVGVSIYPNDERAAEELLRLADEAMYQAKRHGKRQVCFYGSLGA